MKVIITSKSLEYDRGGVTEHRMCRQNDLNTEICDPQPYTQLLLYINHHHLPHNLYNFDDKDEGDGEGGDSQEESTQGDQVGAHVGTLVARLLLINISNIINFRGKYLSCLCPRWTLHICPPKTLRSVRVFVVS